MGVNLGMTLFGLGLGLGLGQGWGRARPARVLPTAQCLRNLGLGYLADLNRESIWECPLNHECCVKISHSPSPRTFPPPF